MAEPGTPPAAPEQPPPTRAKQAGGDRLLGELVHGELGVSELAARHRLPRRAVHGALDRALGAADRADGCPCSWEIAVYLTGRRDVTRGRRRAIASHLAACPACRVAKARVADALERPWLP